MRHEDQCKGATHAKHRGLTCGRPPLLANTYLWLTRTRVRLSGYGNIAPSTEGGKIFCILYAIFGIPLFGFLLAGVGDQLGTIFVKSIAKVEKTFRRKNERDKPGLRSRGVHAARGIPGWAGSSCHHSRAVVFRRTRGLDHSLAAAPLDPQRGESVPRNLRIIFASVVAGDVIATLNWSGAAMAPQGRAGGPSTCRIYTLTTVGIGEYALTSPRVRVTRSVSMAVQPVPAYITAMGRGGDRRIEYREWYRPLVWFWILVGLAYFAAVLSMIGDWLRVLSKKTKEEVVEIKAHAAEWKANVRAEFRETRRRMSVEVHDKLQRAATIRSMERRQLGLDQRAVSLDVLSPERRAAAFNGPDAGCKTPSQESIDTKINNLRLRGVEQAEGASVVTASEDNIFNRLGSISRLARRGRNRELKKNICEEARRPRSAVYPGSAAVYPGGPAAGPEPGRRKDVYDEDDDHTECNASLSDFPLFAEACKPLNGFLLTPRSRVHSTDTENEENLETVDAVP
ncbi:unnamed protein product [Boreogadus saida]